MKDKQPKKHGGVNRRSLRWIFASRKTKIRMLIQAANPEKKEELWRRIEKALEEQEQSKESH